MAGLPGAAQAYWNNAPGSTGSFSNLVDSAGLPTTLSATFLTGSCGTGDNGTAGATSDFTLMRGFLRECGPFGPTFSIFDVPYAVYDVIVYLSGPGQGAGQLGYHGPPGSYYSPPGDGVSPIILYSSNFTGAFVEATPTQPGNYYRFRGLNYGGSVQIGSGNYFSIAAAQIVRVPGPATVPTRLTASYFGCCVPQENFVDFSLDGTHLAYIMQLNYPYGANPRLELHGPAPVGQDGPLVATLPSPICNDVDVSYCMPITGAVEVTTVQAAELSGDLWYLLVTPAIPHYPGSRSQIINLSNRTPSLQPVHSPTGADLQWPIESRDFILETTPILGPGAQWQAVTNQVQIVNGNYSVSVDWPPASTFFRLRSWP